jgi:hypothetical protein
MRRPAGVRSLAQVMDPALQEVTWGRRVPKAEQLVANYGREQISSVRPLQCVGRALT